MSQRIEVRVRNRMIGNKADYDSPWEYGDNAWQYLKHRLVTTAGQGPGGDSTRAWMDPQNLMGRKYC